MHEKTFQLSSRTPRIPFNVLSRTDVIIIFTELSGNPTKLSYDKKL